MMRIRQDTAEPQLTLYTGLYKPEFNYEEFKENAFLRLKILRKVENNIKDTSLIKTVDEDLNTHFCLRLVCAQSKWALNWFVNQETQLFRHKIMANISDAKKFFLEKVWPHLNVQQNIEYTTIYNTKYSNTIKFTDKVLIHFTKCSDILPKRNNKLVNGYFELTDDVLISFLIEIFREHLDSEMINLYEKIIIDSDERLINLNKTLFTVANNDEPSAINDIMKSSHLFPLCIKGILQRLKTEKHLKYLDRQALCLFFKDIGMSLNECIEYFKTEFNCTTEKFNKEYLYYIRHNYGLEGKRANYHSFSCSKIIGYSNDRTHFGCPFINNHDFVKMSLDIEDLNKDAIKCCTKTGEKMIKKPFTQFFQSPADYFKILFKEENNIE